VKTTAREAMTERLVDNAETGFRELWDDEYSTKEPLAWIASVRLTNKQDICWTSEWMVERWKPEKPFGYFKGMAS
jgi:hypothetical protein